MPQPSTVHNPFQLMLAPEAVLQAVERSGTLTALRRRTCRPLDRPLPGSEPPENPAPALSDDDPAERHDGQAPLA